jgi:hypothetical protein
MGITRQREDGRSEAAGREAGRPKSWSGSRNLGSDCTLLVLLDTDVDRRRVLLPVDLLHVVHVPLRDYRRARARLACKCDNKLPHQGTLGVALRLHHLEIC